MIKNPYKQLFKLINLCAITAMADVSQAITVQPFSPEYQEQVITLIRTIQRDEFNLPVTLELQPDLQTIPTFYQKDNGNFWIALIDGNVVGTVGLLDMGNNQGSLRKMFVDSAYRGKERGIAEQLLNHLITFAQEHGISTLYLATVPAFKAAQRFYEKNGFVAITQAELPEQFQVKKCTLFYKRTITSTPDN